MQTKISWIIAGAVGVVGLGGTAAFATVTTPIEHPAAVPTTASASASASSAVESPAPATSVLADPSDTTTTEPTTEPTAKPTTEPAAKSTTDPAKDPVKDPSADPGKGCDNLNLAALDGRSKTAVDPGGNHRDLRTGAARPVQDPTPAPAAARQAAGPRHLLGGSHDFRSHR